MVLPLVCQTYDECPVVLSPDEFGEELHDGVHEAIVDGETWEAVRTQLAANANADDHRPRTQKDNGALLQGLARCVCGGALTYHYTKKGDRRYAYYVCTRQQKEGAAACPGSRVAAGKLESFVVDQVRAIGRDPAVLEATLQADRIGRENRQPELVKEARRLPCGRVRRVHLRSFRLGVRARKSS